MSPDAHIPQEPRRDPEAENHEPAWDVVLGHATAKDPRPEKLQNEDRLLELPDQGIVCVVDGAGGHRNAATAAQASIDAVRDYYLSTPTARNLEEAKNNIALALKNAHDAVADYNYRVGSNSVAAAALAQHFIEPSGVHKVLAASIGDVRAYIVRANGSIEQATTDNVSETTSEARFDEKRVQQEKRSNQTSFETAEDTVFLRNRHKLSYALGHDEFENPRISVSELHQGDIVILLSDGIHDVLTDDEIAQIATSTNLATGTASRLVEYTAERAADPYNQRTKKDDATALVMKFRMGRETLAEGSADRLPELPSHADRDSESSVQPGSTDTFLIRSPEDGGEILRTYKILNSGEEQVIELDTLLGGVKIELLDDRVYRVYDTRDKPGAHGDIVLVETGHDALEYATGQWTVWAKNEEPIILGRKQQYEGRITTPTNEYISRKHLVVMLSNGSLHIADPGSAHGRTRLDYDHTPPPSPWTVPPPTPRSW